MSMSNFGKISCEDIEIFQFFKMAGDVILDFQICEMSGRPRRIIMLNVVKIGRLVVETLHFCRIFKMAVAAILDF